MMAILTWLLLVLGHVQPLSQLAPVPAFQTVGTLRARAPEITQVLPEAWPIALPSPNRTLGTARPFWGLTFDGTNDYIKNAIPVLQTNTTFTIMAWVKATVLTGSRVIYAEDATLIKEIILRILALNMTLFTRQGAPSFPTSLMTVGKWHHIAGTSDGTNITIYLDGIPQDTVVASGAIAMGSDSVHVGARQNDIEFWAGKITQLRVGRGVARTAAQVPSDMLAHSAVGWESAYWRMTPGSGQTVLDLVSTTHLQLGSTTGADTNDPTWTGLYTRVTTAGPQ